jgi:error-prone DNA polymerase
MSSFVELHAQSAFSFLEGAEQPETLATEAARRGMSAVALVDRDGVYGAARFHRAAVDAGIRALLGSELTLAEGARLPLLVEDREGWQNLCRAITAAKLGAPKGRTALTLEALAPYARGLVCLTGGARGPLAGAVRRGDRAGARRLLDRLVGIFGRDSTFVEVQRHFDRAQERDLERLVGLARDARVPLVATNQPLYARPGGRAVADVFTCLRDKTDLDHAGRRLLASNERRLRDAAEMREAFHDLPEAVATSGELALRLGFTLKDLGYRFPDFPLPPGASPLAHLRDLTARGVRARYGERGPLAARARRQVEHELAMIGRLDLAGYFLIVWDIVEFCRAQDILVQGRGSAANSAVCYALGITAVDPVGMELLFERFLSESRGEWPDIDLDLPSGERREAVIQYVYRRYGRLGAGMTANVISYRGRSAAREVGKALGLPADMRDRLARLVETWGYQDPEAVLTRHLDEAGCDTGHPRIRKFAALWTRLQDLPRHLGQHSGGMVIAAGRLDDVVPLEPATMPGRVVVQWDKDDCAALGIVKVDLLGLRMMSALQEAITLVRETGGAVDLARLPPDDPAVYRMLQRADTIGVFQVESRAQMATLPRIHPERFYDLVVQIAIIRPGPIVGDMVHPYIRRRRGREPVAYAHPSLKPILARTLGVPLFQEQLLRMAMVTAGFTGSEAEELRRAFGFKRSERRMAEVEVKLREGMARQGITGAAADQIVHQITSFALYGFPECVVGGTRVLDADTGRRVPVEDVVNGRAALRYTLACDNELRLQRRRVVRATASGRRLVYRLRTALGRDLVATAEHPLLTMEGWKALASLRPGDRVAAARALPPLGRQRWPRHHLVVLAGLLTEGNLCHPSTFYFYTSDARHCDDFVDAVERFPNTRATIARHRECFSVHVRRAVPSGQIGAVVWAQDLGLRGHGARDKHLPPEVFELRAMDLALLLARMWDGDGSVSSAGHISYDTVSRELADGVQHLLLRLRIVSRLYERTRPYRGRRLKSYVVTITGHENLARFWRTIGRNFLHDSRRAGVQALARGGRGRGSCDIIPMSVRSLIRRERLRQETTWEQLEAATRLSMRAVSSPSRAKHGYRRHVIARLGRYFKSPELIHLATSDLYWDRVVTVEQVGERETYDLEIEGDHNFLANDLVVHNSHSSSFALLAYASAYLKAHHGPAFYAALLNNQPMGFYHAATVVNDARRHGVRVLPVDVTRSDWPCTLERGDGAWVVRLGLRYVKGLREGAARALMTARAGRPFASAGDLAARAGLARDEMQTLAAIGALAPLGGTRRANIWAAADAGFGPLFTDVPPGPTVSPLREMTTPERLVADYAGTGVTLGPHPMALRRAELAARGVRRARDLAAGPDGERVRVAGSVIVRQRPGTAKGFVFLSLEDETGIANVIVTPGLFAQRRWALVAEPFLLVEGILQMQDGVVSVRAARVEPLPRLAHVVPSHDFG